MKFESIFGFNGWASAMAIVMAFAAAGVAGEELLQPVPTTQKSTTNEPDKFIDTHVHFNPNKKGAMEPILKWMKENHVQRVINHPLQQSLPRNEEERKQMIENYNAQKGKIDHFCIFKFDEVKSEEEAIERLKIEKQNGAIGFGEHYGEGLFIDDPQNMRLYAACEKVGMAVMFHMDSGKNKDEKGLPHLENVLKAYPKCVIIAHSDWWRHIGEGSCERLLKTYPNFYADISCTVKRSPIGRNKELAKKFFTDNADKLLFGSDSGWWSSKLPSPEFGFINELGLPKEAEDKILRGNANRLFPVEK